tara:strand:- start:3595 stop:4407 length:813 start_codon:yes stop_codon:yes gene_type:complete
MLPPLDRLNPHQKVSEQPKTNETGAPLSSLDTSDLTRKVTRDACRKLADSAPRAVVALYANPRIPLKIAAKGLQPLNALTREMRSVISQLNPFDFFLSPSTTKQDLPKYLKRYNPKVLLWSGHTLGGMMIFEDTNGRLVEDQVMTAQELEEILNGAPSLTLVCLMACSSSAMLPLPDSSVRSRVSFITWSTITEDNAALAFTSGMVEALAEQVRVGEINAAGVFEKASTSFRDGGFRFGDPKLSVNPNEKPHGIAMLSLTEGREVVAKGE